MCVVTQTVERVAREVRVLAERQSIRAQVVRSIVDGYKDMPTGAAGELRAMANNLDADAVAMRASAKLLDGKE